MAPPWHCEGVTARALDWRADKRVSKSAEQRFADALKSSEIEIPSFRNSHMAPKHMLLGPLRDEMLENEQVCGAVLRIWVESHAELREAVAAQVESREMPLEDPDFKNNRFRGFMPLKSWNSALDGILSECRGEHDPDDVPLMLSMVTGRLPGLIEARKAPAHRPDVDLLLENWLERFRALLASPGGTAPAAQFEADIHEILNEHRNEKEQLGNLVYQAMELSIRFMQELVSLGRELPAGMSSDVYYGPLEVKQVEKATSVMGRLGTALEEYRAARTAEHASWEMRRKGIERETAAAERVLDLIEELHEAIPQTEEALAPLPDLEEDAAEQTVDHSAEMERLTDENGRLRTEMEALRADYEFLKGENKDLRRDLHFSRQSEESLRERVSKGAESAPMAPVANVSEALERARRQFGGKQLLFFLNGASNPDTQFEKPEEAFAALTWLATAYRSAKLDGGMPDQDQSLREAVPGWSFAPDNSYVAMSKYPDAYSTVAPNGKKYDLSHHIRKGIRNDEKSTMRIAFDWDDAEGKVVIGYVGKHQPNDY